MRRIYPYLINSREQLDQLREQLAKERWIRLIRSQAKRQPRLKNGRFAKSLPKASAVKNNPLVAFDYPHGQQMKCPTRIVKLISATETHITGLEQVGKGWKYKKFLKCKASAFQVLSFNPQAMS